MVTSTHLSSAFRRDDVAYPLDVSSSLRETIHGPTCTHPGSTWPELEHFHYITPLGSILLPSYDSMRLLYRLHGRPRICFLQVPSHLDPQRLAKQIKKADIFD